MEMMKIFVFNMKKYRKKRQISQMKLAEMLNTGHARVSATVASTKKLRKISSKRLLKQS
jgi:DNA-binding transcriptional regulator YiaG